MLNTGTHSLHHIDQFLIIATSSNNLCISMCIERKFCAIITFTRRSKLHHTRSIRAFYFQYHAKSNRRKQKHKREIMVAFQLICPQVMLHKIFCPSFTLNDHVMMVRALYISCLSICLFIISRHVNTYGFSECWQIASTHFHLENYLPIK